MAAVKAVRELFPTGSINTLLQISGFAAQLRSADFLANIRSMVERHGAEKVKAFVSLQKKFKKCNAAFWKRYGSKEFEVPEML